MRIESPIPSELYNLSTFKPGSSRSAETRQNQQLRANNAYTKSASHADVLEAEYVDKANPIPHQQAPPPSLKDHSLTADLFQLNLEEERQRQVQQSGREGSVNPVARYRRMAAAEAPLPGTYLSLIA